MRSAFRVKRETLPSGVVVERRTIEKKPELEWVLQAAAIKRLGEVVDRYTVNGNPPFAFAGDMNGVFLPGMQAKVRAKATGLTAGEPDIRCYFPRGVLKSIEMKGEEGRLTDSQKKRHPLLRALGFEIVVVKVKSEAEAADAVERLALAWMGKPANDDQNLGVAA